MEMHNLHYMTLACSSQNDGLPTSCSQICTWRHPCVAAVLFIIAWSLLFMHCWELFSVNRMHFVTNLRCY